MTDLNTQTGNLKVNPKPKEANTQTAPTSQLEPTRLACIGDSITELTPYPKYTQQILGKRYAVENFGVCGSTVLLDSANPYLYTEAFDRAKEFQPNIAVVMLGTNDADYMVTHCLGNFVSDYITLLGRFQSLASNPRIWIVKPPPIFDGAIGLSKDNLEREIVPAVKEVAKKTSLPLIDVYSALNSPSYFLDGVHPSDAGAKIISEVICKAILPKEAMLT